LENLTPFVITSWRRCRSVSTVTKLISGLTEQPDSRQEQKFFVITASEPELQLRQPLFNGHPPLSNSEIKNK